MLNRSKLILLSRKNKKFIEKSPNNNILKDFKIHEKEITKLKNPSKGQIFIHFVDADNFNLYRFNGKEWLELQE